MLASLRAEKARRASSTEARALGRDLDSVRNRCKSFAGFVKEAWHVIEPGTPLIWNWHLQAMCEHLQAITFGDMPPWLIINVPPGSSKSTIVSVMWQAWEWGPCGLAHHRFVSTSFEEGNVKRDTRKTRNLIMSDWFQRLWPEVEMRRTGETSFENESTGTREGVTFAAITGKRGDRVIIDDPHSIRGAESEADRSRATREFIEGGLNRTNDALKSAMIIVMQRLHEDDLTGVLLAKEFGFVHLNIPMEFEADRRCVTKTANDNEFWRDPRKIDGELMDPRRFPREAVDRLKKAGLYMWAGQYQQRPAPREGGLFKREWFKIRRALPAKLRRVCRAWDMASTEKTATNRPDWTAGVIMAATPEGDFIVYGCLRFQAGPGAVRATVKQTAQLDGPGVVIRIDQDPGQAGKDQAELYVKQLAGYTVKVVRPTGQKTARAEPFSSQAEAGNVYILHTGDPTKDAWIEPFLDELCVFPQGANDDMVDAAANAFNELALGRSYSYNLAGAMAAS